MSVQTLFELIVKMAELHNTQIVILDNEDKLQEYLGNYKRLYFMVENDEIVSLCTLSNKYIK